MPMYELNLSGFKFPGNLDKDHANFRFVVELRYAALDGSLMTAQAVLPGLDHFWECDPTRKHQFNYVRGIDEGDWGTMDLERIDGWDRLIFLLSAARLHSIQFKIFDVDRADGWDKIKNALSSVIGALFDESKKIVPGVFGGATEDAKSFLLKKWAGGDTILFKGSHQFGDMVTGEHKISGAYEIQFTVHERPFASAS
jgi:hypothetical protein